MKFGMCVKIICYTRSPPLAGAWIEIPHWSIQKRGNKVAPPRGGVD